MVDKTFHENNGVNLYSPHQVGMLGKNTARRATDNAQFGIVLDIPGTDIKDYFAPLLPWEICLVQGQTSSGKTEFTNWWERMTAAQLKGQGRDEVIIHVHYEESIEAVALQEYGRLLKQRPADFAGGQFTDWSKMDWAMTKIDDVPIWRIGDSAERPEDAPDLTLSNVYRSIRELLSGNVTGEKFKPALCIVDYLQIIPFDPEVKQSGEKDKRRLQVGHDVARLRKMTTHLQCPIIIPGQAKQELKGNNPPMQIPGVYDGVETYEIATRFDRILSLWRPKMTNIVGDEISSPDGAKYTVTENLAFIKVNKQRGGLPSGRVWPLKVNYPDVLYESLYGKSVGDMR